MAGPTPRAASAAPPHAPLAAPELQTWSLADGYPARVRCWAARGAARGVLVYLHGIQSHGGWYEWSGSLLADCGWAVAMPDRRGSGRNERSRGDVDRWRTWVGDVQTVAAHAQRHFAVERVGLVGVSWGGKLAAACARSSTAFDRLLLIAPGLFPAVRLPIGQRLAVVWSLLTGRGGRLHAIPLNDPALFTANPQGERFIASDSLKLTHVTARFMIESLRMDRWLLRSSAASPRGPAGLVLAEADRIVDNPRTEAWMRRTYPAATIEYLAGAHHTIEFEADIGRTAQCLRDWAAR